MPSGRSLRPLTNGSLIRCGERRRSQHPFPEKRAEQRVIVLGSGSCSSCTPQNPKNHRPKVRHPALGLGKPKHSFTDDIALNLIRAPRDS